MQSVTLITGQHDSVTAKITQTLNGETIIEETSLTQATNTTFWSTVPNGTDKLEALIDDLHLDFLILRTNSHGMNTRNCQVGTVTQ